jgi:hypothetical protein
MNLSDGGMSGGGGGMSSGHAGPELHVVAMGSHILSKDERATIAANASTFGNIGGGRPEWRPMAFGGE